MSEINLLAISTLYTGNTYIQIEEMMDIFSLLMFSSTTIYKIQKSILFLVIHTVYQNYKDQHFWGRNE